MMKLAISLFIVFAYSSTSCSTIVNKFTKDGDLISATPANENEAFAMPHLRDETAYNFTYCSEKPRFRMGSGSLMTYLMRLLVCEYSEGRPWFRMECSERIYDITDYYTAVYTAFCEPDKFNRVCADNRENHVDVYFTGVAKAWMVKYGIRQIKNDSLLEYNVTAGQPFLEVECQQVASYYSEIELLEFSNETGAELSDPFYEVSYSEYFIQFKPFCEPVACGISRSEYNVTPKSGYSCFEGSCQSAIVFIMVFDSILAAIVVVANFLVLAVAVRSSIMRNVPGYFKVSLAIADLMIGLFVLPGSVYNNYILSIAPLPFRVEGQRPVVTDFFNQHYLDFMGIFTVLSFSVSIYTMGGASMDRYLAITKPFRYRQGEFLTKRRATIAFAAIWSFSLLVALYPIFSYNSYQISALSLILSTGMVAAVVYAVTIGLPLIVVWIINGIMLYTVQKDGKNRRTLSVRSKPSGQRKECNIVSTPDVENSEQKKATKEPRFSSSKSGRISQLSFHMKRMRNMRSKSTTSSKRGHKQENVERKLAKTLAVMVGAFTVALLPSVIILILISALERVTSPQHFPITYSPTALNVLTSIEYVASRLFLSNSFWNCIIYSIRNHQFRRALVGVFIFNKEKRRQFRISFRESSKRGRHLSKMSSVESGCTVSSGVDRRNVSRMSSKESIKVDSTEAKRNHLLKTNSTESGCALKHIQGGNKQILIKAYSADSGLTVAYHNKTSTMALREHIELGSNNKIQENVAL